MAKPVKVVVGADASKAKEAFREISEEAQKTEGPLSDFGEKLGGFAKAAAGVAVGVGGAVAGLFAKGFIDGMNTEAAVDKITAQLGLTEEAAERSGEVAKDVFRGAWGESIDEVAQAIGLLHQRDLVDLETASEEVAQSLAEDALTIADVWDKDVNEVIRSAGALMDSELADSAEEAFDIITTGLTEGADANGDFLDTIFEYSTHFDNAGLSADQMIAGLVAGTEAGMMGVDKVGDAVKELGIRIQEENPAIKEALEDIGLDAEHIADMFAQGGEKASEASGMVIEALANTEDPLVQHRSAVELLGTPYEDLGDVGSEVLEALSEGNIDVRDTADVAGDAYDNTATKIEEFKRRGLGALEDFVGAFLSGLGVGGESGSINSGLDDMNTWIAENEEQIREWGTEFAETVLEIVEAFQDFQDTVGPIWDWFVEQNQRGEAAGQDLIDLWQGYNDWFNNDFMPTLSRLGEAFEVMGRVAAAAIKAPINAVIGAWNNLSIPGFGIDLPGEMADFSWGGWNSPNIPTLHSGGMFRAPTPGGEGLALLKDREVVLPAGRDTRALTVQVDVHGSVVTEHELTDAVIDGIIRARGRGVAV